MSSLWTNLLFMHGHIADADLARRLGNTPKPPRPSGKRLKPKASTQTVPAKGVTPLMTSGCT